MKGDTNLSNDFFGGHGHARQTERLAKRTFTAAFVIWLVWAAVCVGLLAGVVYVAWHFLAKVW